MNLSLPGFARHWTACNAQRPGTRRPFRIGAAQVGWVAADDAAALRGIPEIAVSDGEIAVESAAALQRVSRVLADQGVFKWRAEAFDVRADAEGPVVGVLDRGALPIFGIIAHGVHVNGLVRRGLAVHVWVGKRSPDKLLDPDKLDHIVAGGIAAGMDEMTTLVKEAEEEAGIPEALARTAVRRSRIAYAMERPEGLRRDVLHCYDLELPDDFVPQPHDGEIAFFELWPVRRVYDAVRDTDAFKFNVNLVLIDLFQRLGMPV